MRGFNHSQRVEVIVERESEKGLRGGFLQVEVFAPQALHDFWDDACKCGGGGEKKNKWHDCKWWKALCGSKRLHATGSRTQLAQRVSAAFVEAHGMHGLAGGCFHAHVFSLGRQQVHQNLLHVVLVEVLPIVGCTEEKT